MQKSEKVKNIGGSNPKQKYKGHNNSGREFKYRLGYIDNKKVTFNIAVIKERGGSTRYVLHAISPVIDDDRIK